MPYRENDPKVGEDAENRAALERLAAVGLAKKAQLAEEKRSAELAARTHTTSSRFRARAWLAPRKLRFTGFWLATCAAVGLLTGLVMLVRSRDLATAVAYVIIGFVLANVSAITALPVAIVYAIHSAIWRRRDAALFVAWGASLPFPLERFVETLSLDHSIEAVRVLVRFARDAPQATVLEGLVGNLDKPDRVKVVTGEHGCAFFAGALTEGDEPPNEVAAFVREIVAKVLLPLHAVHEIERASLDEADTRQSWDFGDEREKLVALLNATSGDRTR